MLMQQQQAALSRRLAEEQKAYYDKVWDKKVNQMEDEFTSSDKPKPVKKLSFVDKPKAEFTGEQKSVTIDTIHQPVGDPGHKPMTPEEMAAAEQALNEAAWAQMRAEEQARKELEESLKKTTEETPKELVENPVENFDGINDGETIDERPDEMGFAITLDSENEVNELKEELINAGVPEDAIEEEISEPIEPILPGDAEVEAYEETDIIDEDIPVTPEPEDDFDNNLGGLDEDDMPSDMPDDIEDLNIDEEYETERAARLAAAEQKDEEPVAPKRRGRKPKDAAEPKRRKPVVTTKKKKSTTTTKKK